MNRQVISWCLYDFANSSYSAVIAATIFPVFYANYVVGNDAGIGDLWWGRAISLSMAVAALTSPFLGGIADYGGIRKRMLLFFTLLCVIPVASFSLLSPGMIITGFILIVLANIGMEGGLVYYNAFLPAIIEPSRQGRVSAWGFGVGYGGSILSLVFALMLVKADLLNLVWPMTAVYFFLFSLPAFLYLPGDRKERYPDGSSPLTNSAVQGLREALSNLKTIWSIKEQRRFLIAYFVYEDGVNTVICFSSIFAATTLGFKPEELIFLYLIVQATALTGVFVMAQSIDYRGPKRVVLISLALWILVTTAAFFVQTKTAFFVVASLAGLGLGTVQAATRAFYTQFIPWGKESQYFGVYNLVGKSSAVMGPLVFGYLSAICGSQRPAILSVSLFFIVGFIILAKVKGGGPNAQKIQD